MKKIFALLISLVLVCSAALASNINVQTLKISGSNMNNYEFTNGTTVTSDSVYVNNSAGYASLLVDYDDDGGNLGLAFLVSADGKEFYTPYTTDGTTLTGAGAIASAVTDSRWIVLPIRMAKYLKVVFTPATDCTTDTVKLIYQEN